VSQSWNDNLASVAQTYVEKCNFQHNSNRTSEQNIFTTVGENLMGGTGAPNYTSAVLQWHSELTNYTFSNNTCVSNAYCGHYTQVSSNIQP